MVRIRGMSEEEARARIAAQAAREERLAVATYVVDNTGSFDELRARVEEVYRARSESSTNSRRSPRKKMPGAVLEAGAGVVLQRRGPDQQVAGAVVADEEDRAAALAGAVVLASAEPATSTVKSLPSA